MHVQAPGRTTHKRNSTMGARARRAPRQPPKRDASLRVSFGSIGALLRPSYPVSRLDRLPTTTDRTFPDGSSSQRRPRRWLTPSTPMVDTADAVARRRTRSGLPVHPVARPRPRGHRPRARRRLSPSSRSPQPCTPSLDAADAVAVAVHLVAHRRPPPRSTLSVLAPRRPPRRPTPQSPSPPSSTPPRLAVRAITVAAHPVAQPRPRRPDISPYKKNSFPPLTPTNPDLLIKTLRRPIAAHSTNHRRSMSTADPCQSQRNPKWPMNPFSRTPVRSLSISSPWPPSSSTSSPA